MRLAPFDRVSHGLAMRWATSLVAATFLTFLQSASAQCVSAPEMAEIQSLSPAEAAAMGPLREDRIGRVVAPVMVNGQGPFRFIVDTGANRSALSNQLAAQLGLPVIGLGEVHSVHSVVTAPMVRLDTLSYGAIALTAGEVPTLEGAVLAGEHGLLGVDGMAGRRLRLDFERNCIEISPSARWRAPRGWITLRAQLQFGHLVLLRGRVADTDVKVFLDTGSNTTLANEALRAALSARAARRRRQMEASVAYTVGEPVVLDHAILIPRLSIGELQVNNVPAFAGDFHIFRLWGLTEEPALLVGMDVLTQASELVIDYGRGVVQVQPRRRVDIGVRISPFGR